MADELKNEIYPAEFRPTIWKFGYGSAAALVISAVVAVVAVGQRSAPAIFVLIAIWGILPPVWFWFEYYYLFRPNGAAESSDAFQYGQKTSAAIWAGVLAVLIVIASNNWFDEPKTKPDETIPANQIAMAQSGDSWTPVANAIGFLLTWIGLLLGVRQLRASQKVAAGEFLLRFDEMLYAQHDEVHGYLRPGGKWFGDGKGPETPDELRAVERYMGMFERVKILLDDGLVDIDALERFYRYRVHNLVANQRIFEAKKLKTEEDWAKLAPREREADPWKNFIEFWHALELHRRKRDAKAGR